MPSSSRAENVTNLYQDSAEAGPSGTQPRTSWSADLPQRGASNPADPKTAGTVSGSDAELEALSQESTSIIASLHAISYDPNKTRKENHSQRITAELQCNAFIIKLYAWCIARHRLHAIPLRDCSKRGDDDPLVRVSKINVDCLKAWEDMHLGYLLEMDFVIPPTLEETPMGEQDCYINGIFTTIPEQTFQVHCCTAARRNSFLCLQYQDLALQLLNPSNTSNDEDVPNVRTLLPHLKNMFEDLRIVRANLLGRAGELRIGNPGENPPPLSSAYFFQQAKTTWAALERIRSEVHDIALQVLASNFEMRSSNQPISRTLKLHDIMAGELNPSRLSKALDWRAASRIVAAESNTARLAKALDRFAMGHTQGCTCHTCDCVRECCVPQ
jgi:hypothetical protein